MNGTMSPCKIKALDFKLDSHKHPHILIHSKNQCKQENCRECVNPLMHNESKN